VATLINYKMANILKKITYLFFCLSYLSIFTAQPAEAQEKGFIGLSYGNSNYTERQKPKAVNSFFMVRPFDGSNFSWGAAIYSSNFSNVRSIVKQDNPTRTSYEDSADIFQHIAYGTIFGYTYTNNGFFGLQAWLGTGYLSNTIEMESSMTGIIKSLDNGVERCKAEMSGLSEQFYSFPVFLGIGGTVYDFGLFFQVFKQSVSDITISMTQDRVCSDIVGGSSPKGSHSTTDDIAVTAAFNFVSTGIHYRF